MSNQKLRHARQEYKEKQYQAYEKRYAELMHRNKVFTPSKLTLAVRAAIPVMCKKE